MEKSTLLWALSGTQLEVCAEANGDNIATARRSEGRRFIASPFATRGASDSLGVFASETDETANVTHTWGITHLVNIDGYYWLDTSVLLF